MSLADTYAVGFTAPLIMTVMAVPMLGERIRWRRALSTLVGFGGVLIMLRPGGDLWTPVVLLLLAGTLVMALTRIMTRQLTTTETPECQAFWLLICHTVTGVLLLPSFPGAGAIGTAGWLALAFLGLSSGLAHCVFARSYALAPVSALAPFEYTVLPWGVVAGFLAFGDLPSWNTLVGAVVVAASGTYNVYRERVRRSRSGRRRSRLVPCPVSAGRKTAACSAALSAPLTRAGRRTIKPILRRTISQDHNGPANPGGPR